MRPMLLATALLAVALPGAAQEVAYLNLIGVTPETELRHPPAPPPKCNPDGSCQMPGFSTGMSIGCGGTAGGEKRALRTDRKSTRLNSSHANISYAVFCLKKKKTTSTGASPTPHTRCTSRAAALTAIQKG